MAHKKVFAEPALSSWADVDRAMHEMQVATHDLDELNLQKERQITEIKDNNAKIATIYQNRIKKHASDIREYALAHRAELVGKSKKLTFGKVGFRISTALKMPTKGVDIIQRLKELGLHECIKITEVADKETMRKLPLDKLIETGAFLKQSEDFYYELDANELADTANSLEAL